MLVIGASGVLGPPVVRALVKAGLAVRAISRTPPSARALPAAVEWLTGDLLDPEGLARALRGSEVVVNLASAVPRRDRPRPDDWTDNDLVRRRGTEHLLAALRAAGIGRLVQAGVHLVYGSDRGDELLDEDAAVRPPAPLRSAATAERMLVDAATWGLRATSLRLGWLHDVTSWHARSLLGDLRDGHLVVPEDRRWWWSTTAATTAADTIAALLTEDSSPDVLHVVDGPAVEVDQLLLAVAAELGWPRPRRHPDGDARLRRSVRLDPSRCDRLLGRVPGGPERTVAALVSTGRGLVSSKKKKRRHPLDMRPSLSEDGGARRSQG